MARLARVALWGVLTPALASGLKARIRHPIAGDVRSGRAWQTVLESWSRHSRPLAMARWSKANCHLYGASRD